MMKKTWVGFMAFLLVLLCAVCCLAEQNGTCGDTLTWVLDDDGNLTISGSGDMYDYGLWGPWGKDVQTVSFEGSITRIGEHAFEECSKLSSITIPKTVTSIGNCAFWECDGLSNVVIPGSVESIGVQAFYNCSGIVDLTILNGVKSIGSGAFSDCTSLKNVNIANSVESINANAFSNCTGIINFEGPLPNGSIYFPVDVIQTVTITKAEKIRDNSFKNCSSLKSITLPDGVVSIGSSAFSGCSGLTSITLPDGVVSIGSSAFSGCSGLSGITIPNSVETIGFRAFENCSGLSTIMLSDKLTKIEASSFAGCSGLTGDFTIPNSVTKIDSGAFSGCNGITSLTYPCVCNPNTLGMDNLKTVVVTKANSYGTVDFSGCSNLTSITLPNDLASIEVQAFEYCSSLTSITIPKSVTQIGIGAFRGCTSLTSMTLPFVGQTPTTYNFLGYIFGGESYWKNASVVPESLKSVTITNVKSIPDNALQNCPNLTSVVLPDDLTSIGEWAFYMCSSLNNISIPSTVNKIGADAFSDCSNLAEIIIPGGITSIEYNLFSNCSNLKKVTLADNVTTIGAGAFSGCSGLTSISIPSKVTDIKDRAFRGCTGLSDMTLPSSVTNIGANAFGECSKLASIKIPNPDIQVSTDAIPSETHIYCWRNSNAHTYATGHSNPVTFLDPVESITLTDEEITLDEGATKELTFTFEPNDVLCEVEWKSSDEAVATVDSEGKVTCGFGGTAVITLTCGEVTDTCTVHVNHKKSVIDPAKAPTCTECGLTEGTHCGVCGAILTPQETVEPIGHHLVTVDKLDATIKEPGYDAYEACDREGCTYNTKGAETPAGVTFGDTNNLRAVLKDGVLTITGSGVMPESGIPWRDPAQCALSEIKQIVIADGIITISANAFNACTEVTAVSVPASVTTIGSKAFAGCTKLGDVALSGNVTFIAEDAFENSSALIDAPAGSYAEEYALAHGIAKTVVEAAGITLNATKATMYQRADKKNRDILQLTVTFDPVNTVDQTIIWTSSKPKIAKVDETGKVTAIKKGSAVITATTANGKTATCTISVKKLDKKVTKVTAKPKSLKLSKGEKASVVLTFKPKGVYNNKVKWSTSDKKIAAVSKTGVITAKKKGKCVITATSVSSGKTVKIKVTVK